MHITAVSTEALTSAVLALAVAQTWHRHNRKNDRRRCGVVAVNGADFLNALDQEDGMSNQHIAVLSDELFQILLVSSCPMNVGMLGNLSLKPVKDDL